MASSFYEKALNCELIKVSSLETAEFSKVAECVYRDVNIALANELARFADQRGVNMSEVLTASNSQPFSNIHNPGIGVGGHCIPIYPYFFINKGLEDGVTQLSRKMNDSMASYAISKIEKELGSLKNRNILILGLAYRENVKETTKSSALLLMDQLKQKQANLYCNDPLFSENEITRFGVTPLSLHDEMLSKIDVVILQAFHKQYENLNFNEFTSCKVLLDGRNALNPEVIKQAGITYVGIGK